MDKIKITKHSKGHKMEGFKSINTSTMDNPFCQSMHKKHNTICKYCYAYPLLKIRKNCRIAYKYNSDILKNKILSYDELPTIRDDVFRFHSFGELYNRTHLVNFLKICAKNPNTLFALWTKKYRLVQNTLDDIRKPNNLLLVYSEPYINKFNIHVPTYFDKVFICMDKLHIWFYRLLKPLFRLFGIKYWLCKKSCKDCMMCYTHNKYNVILEKIKDYTLKEHKK